MQKRQSIAIIIVLLCALIFGGNVGAQEEVKTVQIIYTSSVNTLSNDIELFTTEFKQTLTKYNIIAKFIHVDEIDSSIHQSSLHINFEPKYDEQPKEIYVLAHIRPHTQVMHQISPALSDYYNDFSYNISTDYDSDEIVALALYVAGSYEAAEEIIRDIVDASMYPVDDLRYLLGNINIIQGDYERARYYYYSTDKFIFGESINLAWTLIQLDAPEQAFQHMNNLLLSTERINIPREIVEVRTHRAQLYALSFDYDSAIVDMDTAIELAEENELDNTTLAELYTIRGEIIFLIYEWDRVLENFNHAIELDPDYAPAYFERGVLYYTMALREEALADFEHYLELAPEGQYAEEAQGYIESIPIEIEALGG